MFVAHQVGAVSGLPLPAQSVDVSQSYHTRPSLKESCAKRSLAGTRRPAKGQMATSLRHLGTSGSRIRSSLLCGRFHRGSKLSDEFASSLAVVGDVVERLLNFLQIQRLSAQPV